MRNISKRRGRDRQEFVQALRDENPTVVRKFIDDFDTTFSALEAAAGRITARAPRQEAVTDETLESRGVSLHTTEHSDLPSDMARLAIDPSAPGGRHRRDSVASRENALTGQRAAPMTSRGTEFRGTTGDREPLNADYKKLSPANAGRFFRIGRVFSLIWHENAGNDQNATIGIHDEPIHSEIRRMVVVRENHGNCWAVPINTYKSQGVAKRGLNQDDIDGHAVIHMSGKNASVNADEPAMIKRPIQVDPADQHQYLDRMSRINFTKVHTVEHNVKVMHIGFVSQKSMLRFTQYWDAQAAPRT